MNKTSTKTLITLLIVLISFIFIVEFTSPIQSINIGHLQKRQDPAPSPDNPPPKDNPPPPKDNPSPPPKDNPSPPPKDNPPPSPPPKDNPTPAPQPAPDTTPNPNPTPAPDPNATPPSSSSTPAPDPNATPPSSPSPPAPNPNVTPTPDPNAPTPNPVTTVVSDTTSNTVSPIVDSSVVTSPNGTTNAGPNPSPKPGDSSISPTVSQSTTTTYPPGREPCTKADDPRCGRGSTDPTVVSTTEENEIITQPSTTPAAPTKSQSQLAPNPKKSTITQFTTFTTTSTIYFPGYSTVTSSKGSDGELTTYATYIPPSTVVVVKKVTSAKIEEIQETNPSSAGHLDLELSVYNLYSVATSLFVIAATMLYLIVA